MNVYAFKFGQNLGHANGGACVCANSESEAWGALVQASEFFDKTHWELVQVWKGLPAEPTCFSCETYQE